MTKVQQSNKLAKNQRGEAIMEQNVAIDDALLPSAVELEKLKAVDASIIPWVMARAEQEQNARLAWNKTQSDIMKFDVRRTHRFNFTALIFAFLLFILVILASVFFIEKGLNVQGTILGSSAIITGIVFFLQTSLKRSGVDKKRNKT